MTSHSARRGRRARGAGGELEGVVHMRRSPRRLKVTLDSPSKLFCVARGTVLGSFHFYTAQRLPIPVFTRTRIRILSCAQLNICQHPVDSNVTRPSLFISVFATDKTNRYASGTRCCEYYKSKYLLRTTFPIQPKHHVLNDNFTFKYLAIPRMFRVVINIRITQSQ